MSKSIFHGAGYYMNDDRASGGKLTEDDTLKCSHCPQGLRKSEWKMQGGMCFACREPLCVACTAKAQKFGCTGPEVKKIEQAVNDMHRREQNAKIIGV